MLILPLTVRYYLIEYYGNFTIFGNINKIGY